MEPDELIQRLIQRLEAHIPTGGWLEDMEVLLNRLGYERVGEEGEAISFRNQGGKYPITVNPKPRSHQKIETGESIEKQWVSGGMVSYIVTHCLRPYFNYYD